MRVTRARTRLAFLLVALAATIVGSFWLKRRADDRTLLAQFDQRADALLRKGDYAGALDLWARAQSLDPHGAWQRTLRFNALFSLYWQVNGGVESRALDLLQVQKLLARVPEAPSQVEPALLPIEGKPEIVMMAQRGGSEPYASLFGEYAGLLGKTVGWASPDVPLEPWQRAVVLPRTGAAPSSAAQRVLYLGPHAVAESRLGLIRDGEVDAEGCTFETETPELQKAFALHFRAPFTGRLVRYRLPAEVHTLAYVRCAEKVLPAIVRGPRHDIAVSFDLSRWLVRLRQGEPALAGKESDGILGLRPSDLFPWRLTEADLRVPRADMVVALLLTLLEDAEPTLRLWPHPSGTRATLILTSDQDFESERRMLILIAALARAGAAPTLYLTSGTLQLDGRPGLTQPSAEFVRRTKGHSVDYSIHTHFAPSRSRAEALAEHRSLFQKAYETSPLSARFHMVEWWGWVEPARLLAEQGFTYDLNFMTVLSDRIPGFGYMTGSGMPLRFYDEAGEAIAVRQLATQMDDHPNPWVALGPSDQTGRIRKLTREIYVRSPETLLSDSAERYHSPLVVNNHSTQFASDPDWLMDIVATARRAAVNVATVAGYDAFLRLHLASGIGKLAGGRFRVSTQQAAQDVLVMNHAGPIWVDGQHAEAREDSRYGSPVRVLTLPRGTHTVELPMTARLERVLRTALLGLLALILAYAASETYLRTRVTLPPDPHNHRFAWPPFLRQVVTVTRAIPGLEPRRTIFTTNSQGLRADEANLRAADRPQTILTLGGSVTECYLLNDGDAWPHQVQELLRGRTGGRVWVGNAGRSGQMTLDYIAHAKLLVPVFRPDLVIVMPGANDVQAAAENRLLPLDLDDTAALMRYAADLYSPGGDVLNRLEPSYTWFFLAKRLRPQIGDFTGFYAEKKRRRYEAPKLDPIPDLDSHVDVYKTNLTALARTLRDSGRAMFMTHPFLWKDDLTDAESRALWAGFTCLDCPNPQYYSVGALRAALQAMNGVTLEVCRAEGITCLDLEKAVDKSLVNFYDDAHLNEEGARRVAEVVADFIIERKLLP